jgi:hypothetical protein
VTQRHSCSSHLRSCASNCTAACRLNPPIFCAERLVRCGLARH